MVDRISVALGSGGTTETGASVFTRTTTGTIGVTGATTGVITADIGDTTMFAITTAVTVTLGSTTTGAAHL